MASPTLAAPEGVGVRVRVQRFGTFLSGMIMPNIGAFIAWGLITALFIPAGFIPNTTLGAMVSPMITYLLPLLIAYTGGKMVHGVRGGVVGAIGAMGVIVGTDIPMFIGAMILGPLSAYLMKKLDNAWAGKIKPGFEMLVDNFSAGILGGIMAIFGLLAVGPIVEWFSARAGDVVEFLVHHGLLPLTSIFIEPAKVLFLNNAINHGILTPLGTEQALSQGKSILFLLEANPGPGLGLLLAYTFFGRGLAKASAPGAAIIQFFGGIHEIYFPYILMKPVMILATIGGGMTGILMLVITNSGLVAPAAPGSIFAVFAMTSHDSYFGVALSVVMAALVSFLIGSFILKVSPIAEDADGLGDATAKMEALKGKKSSVAFALAGESDGGPISNVVFACDAGMGSSAMGASVLRNMIKKAGFPDVKVTNSAISNLTDTYDVVVTHQDLAARAAPATKSAVHVAVDNFMNSPRYEEIVELVRERNSAPGTAPAAAVVPEEGVFDDGADVSAGNVLSRDSIILSGVATTRDDAITEAGALLLARGAVNPDYVKSMHTREESVSTYMGNFLAIPHGTNEAKGDIAHSAVSIIRFPQGIDWNGKEVKFVVGVAGVNNEHLAILSSIARVFTDKTQVARLENATSVDEILDIFGKVNA